jgi:hypothetical protein
LQTDEIFFWIYSKIHYKYLYHTRLFDTRRACRDGARPVSTVGRRRMYAKIENLCFPATLFLFTDKKKRKM